MLNQPQIRTHNCNLENYQLGSFLILFSIFLMVEMFAKETKRCCFFVVVQQCEADSAQVKELPEKSETCSRDVQHHRQNRELGAAPPPEDGDPGFSCMGRY